MVSSECLSQTGIELLISGKEIFEEIGVKIASALREGVSPTAGRWGSLSVYIDIFVFSVKLEIWRVWV